MTLHKHEENIDQKRKRYQTPDDSLGNNSKSKIQNPKLNDPFENQNIQRLQMFFYLVPVLGFFPALWTLYQRQGSQEQQATSRLSVTLALAWLSAYILLAVGATGVQNSELFTLRLLFMNGLLTSGYFVVSFWLMVRLWQHQPVRLPGLSNFAEKIVDKYLS